MNMLKWSSPMRCEVTGDTRKNRRLLLLNMQATHRSGMAWYRVASIAAAVTLSVASTTPAQTQGSDNTLATLSTVYVANASAPWFSTWFEEKEQLEGSLFRPKIQVLSGQALLEKVAADGSSIGLLSKSELKVAKPPAGDIKSSASGFQVCVAIAVRDDAPSAEIGDLALLGQSAKIAATNDTVEIVRALLNAHNLGEQLFVSTTSVSEVISGLSSGTLAVAALPVEPDGDPQIPDDAQDFRYLAMTDAAAKATAGDSFAVRSYSTNRVLGVPLASSINTVCDDIMIVSSSSGQFPPERLGRQDESSTAQADERGGLLDRAKTSLDELWNVIVAKYRGFGQ